MLTSAPRGCEGRSPVGTLCSCVYVCVHEICMSIYDKDENAMLMGVPRGCEGRSPVGTLCACVCVCFVCL
jgi:hypothetical protein